MAKRRYGMIREQGVRPTLPVVWVFCDDAKTAPVYLSLVKQLHKDHCTMHVEACPHKVEIIVEQARGRCAASTEQDEITSTWVLVDLEMNKNCENAVNSLVAGSGEDGVNILRSQPCFEVWTLAHFLSTGRAFTSCSFVIADLRTRWKAKFHEKFPPKKAQADYRKLLNLIPDAIANAKQHNSKNSQSWTEVWKLLEHLESLKPMS